MTTVPGHKFWYPIGLTIGLTILSGSCVAHLHETKEPHDLTLCVLSTIISSRDHFVQLYETDIWPGNLPSYTRQTFDLRFCPVAQDKQWERHLTGEVEATRLDYTCHFCVCILDRGRVALARLPNQQPPIPSGLQGVLAACHQTLQKQQSGYLPIAPQCSQ